MMPRRIGWVGWGVLLLFLMGSPVSARDTGSFTLFHVHPGSSVTIRGSSNLSSWTCTSRDVRGVLRVAAPRPQVRDWLDEIHRSLEDEGSFRPSPPPGAARPQGRLAVPVRSFECGSARMNRDMYRALKAETSPRILFGYYSLEGIRRIRTDKDGGSALQVDLVGGLVLAGRGRTIELSVTFERTGEMTYRVRAEKKTRMSRFGIDPPRALLGIIRARDPISLHFDMSVRSGSPPDTVPRAGGADTLPSPPGPP